MAISYLTLTYFEAKTKEMIARDQFEMVSLLANEIDDKIVNSHDQIIALAKLMMPAYLHNSDKAQAFMERYTILHATFTNALVLFDKKGALVAETPMQSKKRRGQVFLFRDYVSTTLATRKPYISNPYFSSRKHGHPVITLAAPVFGPGGELIGVLGGSIDLLSDNVLSRLISMRIGDTGYFYLATKDRNLILHPDQGRILKRDIPVGANKLLEQAIQGFEGTGETVTSTGLNAIASFKHLKSKDWLVGANFPVTEAYAPIRQARQSLFVVAVVITLFVTIIVWYLMNLVTRPLLAFTRHVENISEKSGETRLLPVVSADEIGRLTQAFNNMVADLDSQRAEIESQRERLAVTLRSIADGVIVTDVQGAVVLMNRVAEKLTGWSLEEALGVSLQSIFTVVDEKSRESIPDPAATVIAKGVVDSLPHQAVLVSRDGSEHFIADSCAPVKDAESRTIGAVLVFQDVTERRQLEKERARVEKLESLGILAGGIAHDYNNILTAIIGNVSLAKLRLQAGSGILPLLDRAEKAAKVAEGLAYQLLTFSKGGEPVKRTSSIAELIPEAVSFALHGSNVRSDFSITQDLWPVDIDRGQISQVLQNLTINAKQAMPEGGIIIVGVENCHLEAGNPLNLAGGRYVKISLRDTGTGITEANLPKIFDPYFTTKPEGSGLGLATSYAIIKKHQGIITAHSTEDRGATFGIYLPASEQALPEKADGGAGVYPGTGSILVMDDDEAVRGALLGMLTHLGYRVELVNEGSEAILRYAEAMKSDHPFDLVIMDLTIPGGIGGRDAIQHLKKLDPDVRAIVSSGYSNDPVMSNYREYGFAGMVLKPYHVSELSEQIKRILRD